MSAPRTRNRQRETCFSIRKGSEQGINYEYILYSGVLYWLVRQGFTNSDPRVATVQYRDSEDAWKEAKADYKEDLDNIDQSSDSVNMIGLGSPDNY